MDSYNHLETLSASTSSSLPNTRAATAEGANPTTHVVPWWCSQISLTADIADVFPVPAGPVTADKPVSEVSTAWHACTLSSLRGWPPAMRAWANCWATVFSSKPWPADWVAVSMTNCSWSMMVAVVYTPAVAWWSNTDRPRLATATSVVSGLMVDRSGVSDTAISWAVATRSSATARRSSTSANRTSRVIRWAEANRFARVNVERLAEVSDSTQSA